MVSFVTDLAKTIAEKLIDGAISESRYICCFTCITEDFEKEKKRLKARRKSVGQKVKAANRRGEDILNEVTFWQEEAEKLIQEDTITNTNVTCFFGLCPNCKWRYERGKELADKTDDIRTLMQSNFENVSIASNLPGVEYHSSKDYIPFKSRDLKYKQLLEALIDDSNYIIGLQGMGGTGKTTLANKVGKELKQSKRFDQVIDTTVSYSPNIRKIQDDIAAPLGLKLGDCNESERPKKLWSRLTNGEKILVILDDVWGDINFEEIGIPYSDNHKGCRVLVTTRNLWVCNSIGCQTTIQLGLLSEEDAWVLFQNHAGIKDGFPKVLVQMGQEIVKECKGLPIAIAAIASSLKGQRKDEWSAALISLRKPMPIHGVDENLTEVYKCLRHSYDHLMNEGAKGLFLLFSLFPEDEEIPIELLTRFGIAVGLFGEVDGKYDEARSQLLVAKNKLVESCLLLEAGLGNNLKMHDLVREVALWIANKKIQAVNLSNKNQKTMLERENNIEYLFCEGKDMDVFSCKVNGPEIKLVSLNITAAEEDVDNSLIIPTISFEKMTKLRDLHISYNYWEKVVSLPQSIQSLTDIRSIFLMGLNLGDISILGQLRSLETLDLFRCTIDELPCDISELDKLRLLTLDSCFIERNNPFEVIEKCLSLEELYLYFRDWDNFLGYNLANDKKITFPAFQRCHIFEGGSLFENKKVLMSKYVSFSDIDAFFSEATFKYLVQTAEFLRTNFEGGWRNLMPEIVPIDEGMNDLVELQLEGSGLQCLIDTARHIYSGVPNVFSSMVYLIIRYMNNFEELCNGPLPFDFLRSLERLFISDCKSLRGILLKSKLNLCNLKSMELRNCRKLEYLFQVQTSQSLVMLEELIIWNCEQLKNIITNEGQEEEVGEEIVDDGDGDNMKSHGSMFPNLKILRIRLCPQLQYILPSFSAQDVPLLEVIEINNCGELKYIFGQYQHEHGDQGLHHEGKDAVLSSLTKLKLDGLPSFIDVFPECSHPMCSSVRRLSSRDDSKTQLKSKNSTTKRKTFPWTDLFCCYGKSTTALAVSNSNDQLQDYSISLASKNSNCLQLLEKTECRLKQRQLLCNIKEISLVRLSKLKSIFILSLAPTMLLETLRVYNCDELKHIIVDIGNECSDSKWSNVFPKLKEIIVKDCQELESLFGEYPPHSDPDTDHDVENNNHIHIQLPALTRLEFEDLQKLIGICSRNYRTTLPYLREVRLSGCPRFTIKSTGDIIEDPNSRLLDNTVLEAGLSRNIKNFHALERVFVRQSEAENILGIGEVIAGAKSPFTFRNLKGLKIMQCEKLQVIFFASVIRCLPQLDWLIIRECKELKEIVEEEDVENEKILSKSFTPNTCLFPKLRFLEVTDCNTLKCVLTVSTSKELPKLEILKIKEALKLEQIFRFEQKVELPNLKVAILVGLPSLSPRIESQIPPRLIVYECSTFSSTSTLTVDELDQLLDSRAPCGYDDSTSVGIFKDITSDVKKIIRDMRTKKFLEGHMEHQIADEANELSEGYKSEGQDTNKENPITETAEDIPVGVEVQDTSGHELSSSLVNSNGIESIEVISVETNTKATNEAKHEKDPGLEISSTAIVPIDTEQNLGSCPNSLDIPLHNTNSHDNKISNEEGTTSTNSKTVASSTYLESHIPLHKTHSHELLDEPSMEKPCLMNKQQSIGETSTTFEVHQGKKEYVGSSQSHETSKSVVAIDETYASVTLNDDPSMKACSIVKEHFSNNDNNMGVSVSVKSFSSIPSPIASNYDSVTFEGEESVKSFSSIPSPIASNYDSVTFEDSKLNGGPSPSPPDIHLHKTHSHELLEEQSKGEPCLMNKQQPLGETDIAFENLQGNKEVGDGQIAIPCFPVIAAENPTTKDFDVSHSQETSRFVVALTETHAPESMSSPAINSCHSSKSPPIPFEGNPSQVMEGLSFASLVTKELEQLVSKKHLAYENMSLLIDFLVKHPSVRLTDKSFSNRYKGYAYNCLAELLNFLQTHSVLDVLESSHSDFVELLQDVHRCGFDKDWLDDVERRVLFPGLQVSQDAMEKLSHTKSILTQRVEDLKHQMASSEADLERILQQEISEARAALRAPIGY